MSVRLIAVSKPEIEECADASDLVAYCARVSNPSNQANSETAGKLLRYLAKNQHWSPFEMVSVTMEIVTTRDIARQILRHRSFSFQEFSQRYAAVMDFADPRPARMQDARNRQASTPAEDQALDQAWRDMQTDVLGIAEAAYKLALEKGIAKEVARSVLPEGLTVSKLYMAGTLRSWIHYISLRTGNGTQLEHKAIAVACKDLLTQKFPDLKEFFDAE